MPVQVWGMVSVGVTVFAAGLFLHRSHFQSASGVDKILALGPVLEAAALAMFAAEHFLAAHSLMSLVPSWLPERLFWTYFVGLALLAAALSLIAWRCVRWSASLLALLFLIIVATIDLPNLPRHLHERLFWTLTVRETAFAGGALVLAGSEWPTGRLGGATLIALGRTIVAVTFVFYAIQHFMFPKFVPGVPLEKMTPAWIPAPTLIAYLVGVTLFAAGFGLLIHRSVRIAAASAGAMLLLLTIFFYVPIFVLEIHSSLAMEGINYVGDTLLFAGTALLAGFGTGRQNA